MAKYITFLLIIFGLLSCAHTGNISNEAKLLIDRGNEYFNNEEYEQAILLYKQAVDIYPRYSRALLNIAQASYNLRNFDNAIKYCTDVIKYEPENEYAHFWRGRSYYEIGRIQDCINDLQNILSLNKGDESIIIDASSFIGVIYARNSEYDKAIEYFSMSINRGSRNDMVFAYRALNYYELQRYKLSIEDANEALRINPNNQIAKSLLDRARNQGISITERGIVNYEITVHIGKTINEYLHEYPYLVAISANMLVDNRVKNSGDVFMYAFDENNRKLISAIFIKTNSDRNNWFNGLLTEFIYNGDNINQINRGNTKIIYNNTPIAETVEYRVMQQLEMDQDMVLYSYLIEYK